MKSITNNIITFAVFINLLLVTSLDAGLIKRWENIGIGASKPYYEDPSKWVFELINKKKKPVYVRVRNHLKWYPSMESYHPQILKPSHTYTLSHKEIDLTRPTYICFYEMYKTSDTYEVRKGPVGKYESGSRPPEEIYVLKKVFQIPSGTNMFVRIKEEDGVEIFGPQTGALYGRAGSEEKGTAHLTDTGLSMEMNVKQNEINEMDPIKFNEMLESLKFRSQTMLTPLRPSEEIQESKQMWRRSKKSPQFDCSQSLPNMRPMIESAVQNILSGEKELPQGTPEQHAKPTRKIAGQPVFQFWNKKKMPVRFKISNKKNDSQINNDGIVLLPGSVITKWDTQHDITKKTYINFYDESFNWTSVYKINPGKTIFVRTKDGKKGQEIFGPQTGPSKGRKRITKNGGFSLNNNVTSEDIQLQTATDSLRVSRKPERKEGHYKFRGQRLNTEEALKVLNLQPIGDQLPDTEEIDQAWTEQNTRWNPATNREKQLKDEPHAREVTRVINEAKDTLDRKKYNKKREN